MYVRNYSKILMTSNSRIAKTENINSQWCTAVVVGNTKFKDIMFAVIHDISTKEREFVVSYVTKMSFI